MKNNGTAMRGRTSLNKLNIHTSHVGKCSAFPERPKDAVCVGYEYAGSGEHAAAGGHDKPTGSGGTVERTCLNCSHYDPMGSKCLILPSYDNYMYHTCSCDNFKDKQEGPSQPVDDTLYARYRHGSIECIDAIRAALTPEEFRGFCKGNVMKYVWRERHKGGDADLDKARDYVGYAVAGDDHGEL